MNIKRIGVLLTKELVQGSKSFFFIFAVIGPLLITAIFQLVFDTGFSTKPKLGIYDLGDSQITKSLQNETSIDLKTFLSEAEIKSAVETGAYDLGIVLPRGIDSKIKENTPVKITAYIFGESLLKNRVIIGSVFLHQVRKLTDRKTFVEIVPVSLGDEDNIPWKDRVLPLIVLMAIVMGGFLIPATSLVEEKQKRTLGAVLTTPVTQAEVFLSKGLMGVIVSMIMGIAILLLNHSFSERLGLIILIMFFGAVMAACISLMSGAFMKDIASLYAVIKSMGIILYGPAIVYMFPQIPAWVGKLFPTYYMINPLMEITQKSAGWAVVANEVYILIAINIVFIAIVGIIASKTSQQEG